MTIRFVPASKRIYKLLLTPIIAVTISACGGGGPDSPETGAALPESGGNLQQTDSLTTKSAFNADDIRHFLSRTHFSIEPGKTAEVEMKGLPVYVDEMMEFGAADTAVGDFEQQAHQFLLNDDDPAGLAGMFPSVSDVIDWNVHLLMNNPNAFQEVMGMFWQDHFGVDFDTFRSQEDHLMIDYVKMLRERGVDHYDKLLLDVSRHGAMLVFLDGADNSKFAPNENYAREFWELFTFGVDNGYSETDVLEASRAFTGWRREFNADTGLVNVVYDPENKAIGSKQPLGSSVGHTLDKDDYDTMVDLTMQHSDTSGTDLVAEFLSTKLLRYFYHDSPSEQMVSNFADVLRNNNLHVGASLRTLFLSEAFYSEIAREGLVRDFYEQVVGLVRSTGLTESAGTYRRYLYEMESIPSRPPSVEGWPEGDDKISSHASGVAIPNFANELITNRNTQLDDGYDIGMALQPPGASSAGEVIDHVAMLLGVQLDSSERQDLIDYMNVQINSEGEETPLLYTPQNTDHQDRKLRNLLWILCQHPTFQIK